MISERKYFFKEIGEVSMKKKSGVKRLTIRISRQGEVKVTIPYLVSYKHAEQFVAAKSSWILKTKEKINFESKTKFHDGMVFQTRFHAIEISKTKSDSIKRINSGDTVKVYIPGNLNILSDRVQEEIRFQIIEVLRAEAKIYLIPRVYELAGNHGFSIKKVYIKNLKSRWGSCSAVNNINLNLHLMRLPEELADYVILHELTHTKHKHHGPGFWKALETITGDSRVIRKELKKYNTSF